MTKRWPGENSLGQCSRHCPTRYAGAPRRPAILPRMRIAACSRHVFGDAELGVHRFRSVAQRGQEIGIRLALGAESRNILRLVVVQGLRPALVGVACGLAAALALTRPIAGFLFGVSAWDPLVFFMVPVILVGVAVVAAWLPVMRASRIDPAVALRHE